MLRSLFLCFFLLICSWSISQTNGYRHEVFTKEDGFELDHVNSMIFDKEGFLWMGGISYDIRSIINSDHRLSIQRFNGLSFHTFYLPKTKVPIIEVSQLYLRGDGKIYVYGKLESSGYQLLLFDPLTGKFTEVEISNGNESLQDFSRIFKYNNIDYIISQSNHEVIVNILHKDLSVEKKFSFLTSEEGVYINSETIFLPFDEYCLIGDNHFSPKFLDWNGKLLKEIDLLVERKNATRAYNKYKFIDEYYTVDDDYFILLRDDPNLYKLDKKQLALSKFGLHKYYNSHVEVAMDSMKNIYSVAQIGSKIGIYRVIGSDFRERLSLPNVQIESGLRLVSNNFKNDLWFSNIGELHHVLFLPEDIKKYMDQTEVRSLFPLDSEKIIVAKENKGWKIINPKTQEVSDFEIYQNGKSLLPLSSRNIVKIKDKLWSNNYSKIIEIDPVSKKVNSYKHYPVTCLEQNTDSTLIYGTNKYHLMEFNMLTKEHRKLIVTDTLDIYDIAIKDHLVVGATDKGILSYNLRSKETKLYTKGLKDIFYLMTDYDDKFGFLLGSRSGKIVQFDIEKEKFTTIYEDEKEAGIATIVRDNDTFWINTFNGLVAFNYKTNDAYRYSTKDGLSHNEGNRYSALKTEEGIFMGSLKGVNFFKPEELKPATINSQITLLKVRKFNAEENKIKDHFDRTQFQNNTAIILPAEHKELQLEFGLKNNTEYRDYRFEYRLNNNNWIDLKTQNHIHFPNLAVGDHELQVRALDFSNRRIGKPLFLKIQSKNFFYKTPAFITSFFLALIAILLYIIYQGRSKKKMQEQFSQELLSSREEERSKIAKDLHDGIGQQLTLIKKFAQKEQQEKFSNMTHNVLEEVRSISRGLYPSVLKQLGLTDSIEQLILDCDERTDIFFTHNLSPVDDHFDRDQTIHFYRFVQEALNNIVKHSEATTVNIIIAKKPGKVRLFIEDDGKGFNINEAKNKNSLGLKTLRERIKLLKGNLEIKSKIAKGTMLIVEIPI